MAASAQTAKVLIFSATLGFRHDSIPTAISQLQAHGPANGIIFDNTEDSSEFNDGTLAEYDAILFLMVTDISPNDILNASQQSALQAYFNKGGNYVGIHSASDCLHDVDFYGREVGAYFLDHATIGPATFLNNIDPTNPIVSMIPSQWSYEEEVYNFKSDPRSVGAKVILTVDETSSGGEKDSSIQGSPHPIAWYQDRGAGASANATLVGRSFYTSLGHLNSTWMDTTFMGHVMAGISWTLQGNTTKAFSSSGLVGNASSNVASTTGVATQSASSSSPTASSNGNNKISPNIAAGSVVAAAMLLSLAT